ncbi:hypothetical protein Q760_09410 [Cellulomonas cellasea DSM 20118]|uniref:Uncharacterized protein n=1 Tax=Cellulomonas cellasea DSM 20118 TaxID=1408250 RepID=A0A0A0B8A3_9CELL|nr:hypothetical protein Q760_09410 [Cellulomonas cellasea DSM 20118]
MMPADRLPPVVPAPEVDAALAEVTLTAHRAGA